MKSSGYEILSFVRGKINFVIKRHKVQVGEWQGTLINKK